MDKKKRTLHDLPFKVTTVSGISLEEAAAILIYRMSLRQKVMRKRTYEPQRDDTLDPDFCQKSK